MHRCGIIALLLLCLAGSTVAGDSLATTPWKPSPTGAAFRSFIFPGWGQSYNHRPLKAVVIGGIEQGLIFGIYREHQLFRDARKFNDIAAAALYKDQRNRLVWLLAGCLIYSTVDAYVDAHLYDFDVSEQLSAGGVRVLGVDVKLGWITP